MVNSSQLFVQYAVGFGVAVIAIKELVSLIREVIVKRNGNPDMTIKHHEDMARQREKMAEMRHDELINIQNQILEEIKGLRKDFKSMGGWYDYTMPGT